MEGKHEHEHDKMKGDHKKHPHAAVREHGHVVRHSHEMHPDGSSSHSFQHADGHTSSMASGNHDGMMDQIMNHTSSPNPGEAEADAGNSGIPAAAAGAVPAAAGPAGM